MACEFSAFVCAAARLVWALCRLEIQALLMEAGGVALITSGVVRAGSLVELEPVSELAGSVVIEVMRTVLVAPFWTVVLVTDEGLAN